MALRIKTEPKVEPVSLAEAKAHLRIDSEALTENLSLGVSIQPGAHIQAAAYSLEGGEVEVSGYDVLVNLVAGTLGSGGKVDVKLQESEDKVTWSDVIDVAFTQVTTSNTVQEKAYTGAYRYIRAVATVTGATCDFSVEMVRKAGPATEDGELNKIIKAAREYCEGFQNRAYITQVWELWLDKFPDKDYIKLLLPPVQEPVVTAGSFVTGTVYRILSIGTTDFTLIGAAANTVGVCFKATGAGIGTGTATASGVITYYGTDDTAYYASSIALDKNDRYEPKLYLRYGESWPSTTLRPYAGICITYTAGYGDASSNVPGKVIGAMLLLIGHWYEHREDVVTGIMPAAVQRSVDSLLTLEEAY